MQEDELNRNNKTVGECLEYMFKNQVVETICAHAMTDNGFLKVALEIISEMISGIRAISLLSNSTVHSGIC